MIDKQKILKLKEVTEKLKKEFVGLDSIIDSLIAQITPWYVTPEVLDKPLVISLWGITGTGKSSLIRKTINYLELQKNSFFFDCGENFENSSDSIGRQLDNFFDDTDEFMADSDPYGELKGTARRCVFVFDEFQLARTIDELGNSIPKPSLRSIWNLMDSGILDIVDFSWGLNRLDDYITELSFVYAEHPEFDAIKDGRFLRENCQIIEDVYLSSLYTEYSDLNDQERSRDLPYPIIPNNRLSILVKFLNKQKHGLGAEVSVIIKKSESLGEVIEVLKKYQKYLGKPKLINCSKSIIFLLGNLDEAFSMSKDINPDIDADLYHEITSQVNIMDVKNTLTNYFRPEQIGRIGNNSIVYPSLRKIDFQEIISRELSKKAVAFKDISGIDLKFSKNIEGLLYSEGVYPSHGLRPTFTTVNSIIGSKFSSFLIEATDDTKIIELDCGNIYEVPSIEIKCILKKESGEIEKELSFTEALNLGRLRDISRCKKAPLMAIHEASHAVLYTYLTGKYPRAIVGLSSSGGGETYMDTSDSEEAKMSPSSKIELQRDIKVSLAGYYGERYFYPSQDVSFGSSSDIRHAWRSFTDCVYKYGYFEPQEYVSTGQCDAEGNSYGVPDNWSEKDNSLLKWIQKEFKGFQEDTQRLVRDLEKPIFEVARALLKKRCLSREEFKDIYHKFIKEETKPREFDYYQIFNKYK